MWRSACWKPPQMLRRRSRKHAEGRPGFLRCVQQSNAVPNHFWSSGPTTGSGFIWPLTAEINPIARSTSMTAHKANTHSGPRTRLPSVVGQLAGARTVSVRSTFDDESKREISRLRRRDASYFLATDARSISTDCHRRRPGGAHAARVRFRASRPEPRGQMSLPGFRGDAENGNRDGYDPRRGAMNGN